MDQNIVIPNLLGRLDWSFGLYSSPLPIFYRDKASSARQIPRGMEDHQGGGEADGEG